MSTKRHRIIPGYVWCDFHAQVHEAERDPFGEGVDCSNQHRPVYGRFTDEEAP